MTTRGPVALIILDGFGLREEEYGNAVLQARKPNFDRYWQEYPHAQLRASGQAVGLPEGQMGNSEVGHLNIGAGRIVYQDLTRISLDIEEGGFFENPAFVRAMQHVKENGTALHIAGLLSDGGVHSHIEHIWALLRMARAHGLERVYVHAFLDGRDVAPDSGVHYIRQTLDKMQELGAGRLATLQGRYYAMDRDKRWERTERAYRALVYGEGDRAVEPLQAVREAYAREVYDEFIPPVVLTDERGEPLGKVGDGDALIFCNFRPDRAIQLSEAFTRPDFSAFERGPGAPQNLFYVCLTHFSETIPAEVAYEPNHLANTMGQVVAEHGLRQLRIAETEKYPHVTYFFSGGKEDEWPGEKRILIPSPKVATYDLKPEMSAYEVTERLVDELRAEHYDLIVLNFANPDMVGHSGKMEPTIRAVEAVDECLGQVVETVLELGGVAVIIADHGNADEMLTPQGEPITSHSTNPVPFILTRKGVQLRPEGILADVAPTLLELLGLPQPPEMTGQSMIAQEVAK